MYMIIIYRMTAVHHISPTRHSASFWNIIIQWTSHGDLTEKSAENFLILQYGDLKKKNLSNDRNSKLHFVIWQKNCFSWILSACSSGLRFSKNLQINLEAMHGSSWNFFSIISEFTLFFAGQVLFTVNGLLWLIS
jgi:hypothetical protein